MRLNHAGQHEHKHTMVNVNSPHGERVCFKVNQQNVEYLISEIRKMEDKSQLVERTIDECKTQMLRDEDDLYALNREINQILPETEVLAEQHNEMY